MTTHANDPPDRRIVVVGGGSSIRGRRLGAAIDSFPWVGRINNFVTRGFEEDVGSRTDIWFNGANQKLRRRRNPPPRIVVLIPPAVLARKGESIHRRVQRRLRVPPGRYELVPHRVVRAYADLVGVERPTTGTMAILWALEHFDEVAVCGFDFFVDSRAHYHDSSVRRWLVERGVIRKGGKHDGEAEKRYVEGLIHAGRLRRLA